MTTHLESPDQPTTDDAPKRSLSIVEILVGIICAVGVVVAVGAALSYSGLTLFDRQAIELVSNAWTRTSTIGLIVALVVIVCVAVFVTILARATIGHDPTTDHDATTDQDGTGD
jgi:LPS O-antigen subunit length determinant protein (WzzB/FepE family)